MTSQLRHKSALVTGATGFVGSHLAQHLLTNGWKVHAITRPTSSLQTFKSILDHIYIHVHDGTTEQMTRIIEIAKPDVVFHLASLVLANHCLKDIVPLLQSNIIFATQLVEAMLQNNIYTLINTGTSWQHYQNKDYSPVCLYAATKRAFEDLLQFYVETTPLKVITLKLFDTYGSGDKRWKLFNQLRDSIQGNKDLDMSLGDQLIDIVYIDDVTEAYEIAANRHLNNISEKYEDFAISSCNPIPLKELVNIYMNIVGKNINIKWGYRKYRDREVMIPWNKGKILPGWTPRFAIEQGIKVMEGIRELKHL